LRATRVPVTVVTVLTCATAWPSDHHDDGRRMIRLRFAASRLGLQVQCCAALCAVRAPTRRGLGAERHGVAEPCPPERESGRGTRTVQRPPMNPFRRVASRRAGPGLVRYAALAPPCRRLHDSDRGRRRTAMDGHNAPPGQASESSPRASRDSEPRPSWRRAGARARFQRRPDDSDLPPKTRNASGG
jgi:hypothetical protein